MAADSMNADGTPADKNSPGGLRLLAIAYLALFSLLILAGVAIAVFGNSGGEALVRIRISDAGPTSVKPRLQTQAASRPAAPLTPAIGAPLYAGTALVADPALIETTDNGPLPRIAADGRTPLQAYAAPVGDATKPRIAIVISGLGISAKATAAALAKLPPQVTLAFAPYASDVQSWVTQARQKGHEVLLEVPMEPFDFPDSDPGPHTLRSGVGEDANTERLVWALTRFTGYTGVTNLLGGRLLSDSDSLAPVLTYLARRGLMFFDNGAATHSVAPDVATRVGVPFAQATLTVDSIQTAMEIDHQLSELETQARANGSASGAGFLYPVTIDRIAQWAEGLSGRGFVLVPASAIVAPKK
jgi:polysaccharide deacetylase 2 family uncharacterized protein YibQ